MARLSKGLHLTGAAQSLLPYPGGSVPAATTVAVEYLSVSNAAARAEGWWLEWADNTASSARFSLCAGGPIAARFKWEPFTMRLVLGAGDRLDARGAVPPAAVNLTNIATINDEADGAMHGTVLTNTWTTILPQASVPAGETWRINGLNACNTTTTIQELFLRVVNFSEPSADRMRTLANGDPIPAGLKMEPLEGELVLNPSDQLQARTAATGTPGITTVAVVETGN